MVEKYKQKKKLKREANLKRRADEQNEADQEELKEAVIKPAHDAQGEEKSTKRTKVLQRERLVELYASEQNFASSLKICVDCSFSDQMSNKEQSRLAQQIGRCYAVNKALERPVHLTLCNLDRESKFYAELCRKNEGFDRYVLNVSAQPIETYYRQQHQQETQLVYLSPDAPEYLEDLNLNTVHFLFEIFGFFFSVK